MKKLLAILGTITIAGSGMAGLVGNAPSPTKNEINSLQTNNLENLNRNKRDVINYKTRVFDEDIIYFTFSRNTFESISPFYSSSIGNVDVNRRESIFNWYMLNYIFPRENILKDYRVYGIKLELISQAIYRNFNKIYDIVNSTNNNWYSLVIGLRNEVSVGNIFSFYPSDSDGTIDQTTIRDNVLRFTIGAICGIAGFSIAGPAGAAAVGGACSVAGSLV